MGKTAASVCLLVCLSVTTTLAAPSRRRRADDIPALQTVVNGHSEQLTQQDARITALQNGLTQLQQQLQQQHGMLQVWTFMYEGFYEFDVSAIFSISLHPSLLTLVLNVGLGHVLREIAGIDVALRLTLS